MSARDFDLIQQRRLDLKKRKSRKPRSQEKKQRPRKNISWFLGFLL